MRGNMHYIQKILNENFISQREFANKIVGIDRPHLNGLINGRWKNPQKKTIRLLSKALSRLDGQTWTIHARNIAAGSNKYWNERFQEIMETIWQGEFRTVPVFLTKLDQNILGLYEHCDSGANCILLNSVAGISLDEMEEVFFHEVCHHIVWEKYGDVEEEHGKEWMHEMSEKNS